MAIETVVIKASEDLSDRELTALLEPAADVIRRGGLVAFPTETVYGLGADGTSAEAAAKIYAAKGRPSDNPLIIHVAGPEDAEKYAVTSGTYYTLAKAFMPGPLTVILPVKDTVPRTTTGGLDTVAVRCPLNRIANRLIALSGTAIAAPSANISGTPSPTNARHVISDMTGRVDVIIDGGDCDFGLESTIVKIEEEGIVTLLRPGKITVEDIESLGMYVTVAGAVSEELKSNEIALSPGMKYKHYAPKACLVLVDGSVNALCDLIKSDSSKKVGVIAYSEDIPTVNSRLPGIRVFDFGSCGDTAIQAHRLFSILRMTDSEALDLIYAPLPGTEGVGLALYNRMIRAAAHKIIKL